MVDNPGGHSSWAHDDPFGFHSDEREFTKGWEQMARAEGVPYAYKIIAQAMVVLLTVTLNDHGHGDGDGNGNVNVNSNHHPT